jgi:jumonji domain-containing protein 7
VALESTSLVVTMTSAALKNLIVSYHELNSSVVDELASEPSPLEFMRYVARNRPFVVRRGARHWPATLHWNAEYLRSVMESNKVNVAITPTGFVTVAAPPNLAMADCMPETRTQ